MSRSLASTAEQSLNRSEIIQIMKGRFHASVATGVAGSLSMQPEKSAIQESGRWTNLAIARNYLNATFWYQVIFQSKGTPDYGDLWLQMIRYCESWRPP
jgi:hypothetical protein